MSFEEQAGAWLRWARTPGHDAYWDYRDPFFQAMLPAPGRRTLEVGCGEGRVARDLAGHGHSVVALDASPTLVASAAAADPAGRYLVADAAALPFPDESFDLVVAYNSLMDVDDLPAAVAEAARVLRPGRPLCVSVTHPTADAGRFASTEPDAPFVIAGSYLGRHRVDELFERDGLQMHFTGWRHPPGGLRPRPRGRRPPDRPRPRTGRPGQRRRHPPERRALAAPPHVPPPARGQGVYPAPGGRVVTGTEREAAA